MKKKPSPAFREDIVYDDDGGGSRFRRRPADDGGDDEAEASPRLALPARTAREIEDRKAAGERLDPIAPGQARNLATSFWGQAWNRYLMECADYASRLPRGRSLLRNGRVLGFQLTTGSLRASVAGLRLYDVAITVQPLDDDAAAALAARLRGHIGSVVDLLAGKLNDDVMRMVADPLHGLFPAPSDIRFHCSCPDDASLCEHAAATLYAAGCHFDEQPADLFRLRGLQPDALVSSGLSDVIAGLTTATNPTGDTLDPASLGDLFGIQLDSPPRDPRP
jgi:hypothetical protein